MPALRKLAHPADGGLARASFTPISVQTQGAAPRTPTSVRLRLDRRTFANETPDELRSAVERALANACASHPGAQGRVEVADEMNAFAADASGELLPAVAEACRVVTGRAPEEIPLQFATNAGYAAALGIDCVAFGPGRIADVGDDEAIGVDRLVEVARIYAAVAEGSWS